MCWRWDGCCCCNSIAPWYRSQDIISHLWEPVLCLVDVWNLHWLVSSITTEAISSEGESTISLNNYNWFELSLDEQLYTNICPSLLSNRGTQIIPNICRAWELGKCLIWLSEVNWASDILLIFELFKSKFTGTLLDESLNSSRARLIFEVLIFPSSGSLIEPNQS